MMLHKEDLDAIRDLIKDVLREEKEPVAEADKPAATKAEKEKK